ncbi:glycosyltransferase [Streptococcus cristatus]|jgi:glycosyltransferase|uniref:glycosyltransferase n=1 Tax=Streptococcus cristatus TaxID=45634 RepID=UPI0016533B81|nr:glycosyltransferase [Streptococcus cristatus]MBC6976565.1 glycosyltransferase [Streptococcus cristatus]
MISILMATYNGRKFIEQQLDSIRLQYLAPDAVIICDDASSDGTYEFIQHYINKYELSTWQVSQNKENLGHFNTFLHLVTQVQEGLVFFSDQDDIWFPDKVSTLSPYLLDPSVAMAYNQSEIIDQYNKVIERPSLCGHSQVKELDFLLKKWPSGYQTAFRGEVLKDILDKSYQELPGFDYHDVLFGMLAPLYGQVIAVDKILDQHRIHSSNVTQSIDSKSFNKTRQSRIDYLEKVLARYQSVKRIVLKLKRQDQEDIVNEAIQLTQWRIKFLQCRKPSVMWYLLKNKHLYAGEKDLVSDIVYAFSLNRWAMWLLKIIKR